MALLDRVDVRSKLDLDEVLPEVARALARFLASHYQVDPNPSGAVRPQTKPRVAPKDDDDVTDTTLIADKQYSVKQAAMITGLSEPHLRKLIGGSKPQLPSHSEERRRFIWGKDIAHYMSRESSGNHEAAVPAA